MVELERGAIQLKGVDEQNFQQCIALQVTVKDENFVDSVEYSLAEAWLYGERSEVFAIYKEQQVIGFVSLYLEPENLQIINFLIADEFQGQGYGSIVASLCIDYLQDVHQASRISLPVYKENHRAQSFWQQLGFILSNTVEDGYIWVRCTV